MQKFTRTLTREIEVAGERLALTLSAEGLSIRPVGSRRPPLSLDWAAVVAAAARGGAEAPKAPGNDLAALLGRLDAWLMRQRKRYHDGLLPGVSDAELAKLSEALGRPLPDELKTWLRWHNGQGDDLIGGLIEAWHPMSAAEIAAAWQERRGENDSDWDAAWIPLLDDYNDNLVVLDASQPDCPVREVWRGNEDHPPVAASLAAWVADFLRDVEAGRYHEDPERGEFRRV